MTPENKKILRLVAALGLACSSQWSVAAVTRAADDGFTISHMFRLEAPPARAYRALSEVDHWWSSEHTWSGKAANLSLKAEAGGCFCEHWAAGSVEHGRVIMALSNQVLRLDAALGPLQALAIRGVLTFEMKPDGEGSALAVTYRVTGASGSGLDKIAPNVDQVLNEQLMRLKNWVDTGKP